MKLAAPLPGLLASVTPCRGPAVFVASRAQDLLPAATGLSPQVRVWTQASTTCPAPPSNPLAGPAACTSLTLTPALLTVGQLLLCLLHSPVHRDAPRHDSTDRRGCGAGLLLPGQRLPLLLAGDPVVVRAEPSRLDRQASVGLQPGTALGDAEGL